MNIPRTGWSAHIWRRMYRYLSAPYGNQYLIQSAEDDTLWQIWIASSSWTWEMQNSFYNDGFPEWIRPQLEPDSPYSALNEELTQDW